MKRIACCCFLLAGCLPRTIVAVRDASGAHDQAEEQRSIEDVAVDQTQDAPAPIDVVNELLDASSDEAMTDAPMESASEAGATNITIETREEVCLLPGWRTYVPVRVVSERNATGVTITAEASSSFVLVPLPRTAPFVEVSPLRREAQTVLEFRASSSSTPDAGMQTITLRAEVGGAMQTRALRVRFGNCDGMPDMSFAADSSAPGLALLPPGTVNSSYATSVAFTADNKIVVGGMVFSADHWWRGNSADTAVWRLEENGSLDRSFGGPFPGLFLSDVGGVRYKERLIRLEVQPSSGRIFAALSGPTPTPASDQEYDWTLLRLEPNGAVDTSYGTAPARSGFQRFGFSPAPNLNDDDVYGMVLHPDGSVWFAGGGNTCTSSCGRVARLQNGGVVAAPSAVPLLQHSTGGIVNLLWRDAFVDREQRVVLCGWAWDGARSNQATTDVAITRFLPNGTRDMAFHGGIVQRINVAETLGTAPPARWDGADGCAQMQDGSYVVVGGYGVREGGDGTDGLTPFVARIGSDGTPQDWETQRGQRAGHLLSLSCGEGMDGMLRTVGVRSSDGMLAVGGHCGPFISHEFPRDAFVAVLHPSGTRNVNIGNGAFPGVFHHVLPSPSATGLANFIYPLRWDQSGSLIAVGALRETGELAKAFALRLRVGT